MADLTMCKGFNCPSKTRCYRALASPDPIAQSWAAYDELRDDGNVCPYFWDVSDDDSPSDNGFSLLYKDKEP